ncbi:zinc ribbon domain-containing protein [Halobacteriales archaeon Cl-PHB]
MDLGRIRSELWKSLRIVWTNERWLLAGPVVAALGYALWVGVTGAALSYLGPMAGLSLALDPWTGTTTALAGLVALLWVVLPALVTAYLVDRQLTNHRDNLRLCYRLGHPAVLLWPPALLLAAGLGALVGLAAAPVAVLVLLVAAAAFLVVRTVAYGYRVVAFSYPLLLQAVVFCSAATLSVAVLVGAATAVGRESLLADAGAGLAGAVGVPGLETILAGTVEVAGAPLPGAVALAVGTMAGLSAASLAVQSVAGLVLRARKPTMKRSQLRTGQRFPWFLKPGAARGDSDDASSGTGARTATTDTSRSASAGTTASTGTDGGSTTGTTTGGTPGTPSTASSGGSSTASTDDDLAFLDTDDGSADEGAEADQTADADDAVDEADSVSHTRVFSPDRDLPDDAGAADDAAGSGGDSDTTEDEIFKRCPACGAEYGRDVTGSFCPDCGARLETV